MKQFVIIIAFDVASEFAIAVMEMSYSRVQELERWVDKNVPLLRVNACALSCMQRSFRICVGSLVEIYDGVKRKYATWRRNRSDYNWGRYRTYQRGLLNISSFMWLFPLHCFFFRQMFSFIVLFFFPYKYRVNRIMMMNMCLWHRQK